MANDTKKPTEKSKLRKSSSGWNIIYWLSMACLAGDIILAYFSQAAALMLLVPIGTIGCISGYKDDKANGRDIWRIGIRVVANAED